MIGVVVFLAGVLVPSRIVRVVRPSLGVMYPAVVKSLKLKCCNIFACHKPINEN
jgi:hypothetical protein